MEDYLDLGRTKLQLTLKVTKVDPNDIANDAKISTTNLLLHSLFSQVNGKLNENLVTDSINNYPYKAYFETILYHGSDSLKSWLQAEMYDEDNPCNDNNNSTVGSSQPGLKKRNGRIKKNKVIQLIGRPHVDIFMQDKYPPPGVDITKIHQIQWSVACNSRKSSLQQSCTSY